MADRLKSKWIFFELVGFSSIIKNPTKVSILSTNGNRIAESVFLEGLKLDLLGNSVHLTEFATSSSNPWDKAKYFPIIPWSSGIFINQI